MPEKSKELANLARIGKLAVEPGTPGEIKGLLTSGGERLADAALSDIQKTPGEYKTVLARIVLTRSGAEIRPE